MHPREVVSVQHRVVVILAAFALVVLGVTLFGASGRDDAHITYFAAESLAETGEIVNYNGDRIEQSSSLLHTLVLAVGLLLTPLSVSTLGWATGILFGAATVLAAAGLAHRIVPGSGPWAAVLAATQPYLVYWSFSGMETSATAMTLLLALWATLVVVQEGWTRSRGAALAAAHLAFVLARPESGLVLVAALGAFAALRYTDRDQLRRTVGVVGMAAALTAAVVGWRLASFGDPFPQPVMAKVGGLDVAGGLGYAWRWLGRPYALALIVAGLALSVRAVRSLEAGRLLLLTSLAASAGATITSGGDWMEAGRLLVGALAVTAVLAGTGLAERLRASSPLLGGATTGKGVVGPWTLVAGGLLLLQVVGIGHVTARYSTGKVLWARTIPSREIPEDLSWPERTNRVNLRDATFVPVLRRAVSDVADATGRQVVVASGQAGMMAARGIAPLVPRVRFVDFASLTTDDFRCPDLKEPAPMGALLDLEAWLEDPDRCGVPLPDVVYNVGALERSRALSSRYTVLARAEGGVLRTDARGLRGVPVPGDAYVAVRNDLLPLLGS